ncbi:hypothetical protein DTO282E5_254 [Paecilomyces variotii]|nr:hypothetical protein DTO282E5_254 [Paecilomyces variotii]
MTPMPTRELDSNPAASLDEKLFTHRQWVRAPSRLSSTGPPCGELVFSNFIFAPDRASDRGPPASWSLRIRVPVYEPEAYFLPVCLSITQVDGFALSRRPCRLQSIEVGIRLPAKGRGASRSFWRLHDNDNTFFSDREPGTILQYHRVSTAYYYSSERSNNTQNPLKMCGSDLGVPALPQTKSTGRPLLDVPWTHRVSQISMARDQCWSPGGRNIPTSDVYSVHLMGK